MTRQLIALLFLCCVTYVHCQAGNLALQAAQNAAASGDKFNLNTNVNPSFVNGKNWNVASSIAAGSNVYRSDNNRHSIGAGVAATHHFGSVQGQHYNTKPNIGAGVNYNYNWQSDNRRHSVGADVGASHDFNRGQKPNINAGLNYNYRFGKRR